MTSTISCEASAHIILVLAVPSMHGTLVSGLSDVSNAILTRSGKICVTLTLLYFFSMCSREKDALILPSQSALHISPDLHRKNSKYRRPTGSC
ncbi:hypothetical protein H4582DRAFT_2007907 [Lactarius indigo]|nr:hypothetical protein H4582DRAFT_2007907 [Lactarius indigo]